MILIIKGWDFVFLWGRWDLLACNLRSDTSFFCVCVSFFAFSRATPAAYGGSQTRGPIGAVASGLCQSPSNSGSEPRLRPTPQLTAMPDPQPTEQGQESNLQPYVS